jgi:hypothetical protein
MICFETGVWGECKVQRNSFLFERMVELGCGSNGTASHYCQKKKGKGGRKGGRKEERMD